MTASLIFSAASFIVSLWIATLLYSFRTTISLAISQSNEKNADKFATKTEMEAVEERLEKQIGLRNEIRTLGSRLGVMRDTDEKMG